jgi:hypothetical protein
MGSEYVPSALLWSAKRVTRTIAQAALTTNWTNMSLNSSLAVAETIDHVVHANLPSYWCGGTTGVCQPGGKGTASIALLGDFAVMSDVI